MSAYLLLALSILLPACLNAQKHDQNWYSYRHAINFTDTGLDIASIQSPIKMNKTSFGISDKEGNFLFYTNGNYIANAQHEIIEGGDTLNIGAYSGLNLNYPHTKTGYDPWAYLVLPDPDDDKVYYFFCQFMIYGFKVTPFYWRSAHIRVSKIDMRANEGRGRVVYRNKLVYEAHNGLGLAAIRHGNGRDWWLLTTSEDKRQYHNLHLYKDSLMDVVIQDASHGTDFPHLYEDLLNPNILIPSQDGNYILDNYPYTLRRYYAFDRCTGTTELQNLFTTPIDTSKSNSGAMSSIFLSSFSPNGRYIYGSSYQAIYQFDLTQEDILASGIRIDSNYHIVSFGNVIPNSHWPFYRLGPDGSIYSFNQGTHNMIRNPDQHGQAADHCHAAYEPPHSCIGSTDYHGHTPFYPNYRLGPLEGSPCDTLSVEPPEDTIAYRIHIWPNPGSDMIQVEITLPEYQHTDTHIRLYDLLGREVYTHRWTPYAYLHTIDVSTLSASTYLLSLEHRGRQVAMERLVIIH